jgi:ubiquinone/menaquinone biosynthesis C-methylase UbiE
MSPDDISMTDQAFDAESIAKFWQQHPCGSEFVEPADWRIFFDKYDQFKFSIEPHILAELKKTNFNGKRVLEIGLGQGAEAQRIIEAGALYNGIDFTEESVTRVKLRCTLFGLPFESLQIMNAERISFPDNSFDIVFSHGVLHHSPRVEDIVREIFRVLKPGGNFVGMLYHRHSINYHVSIKMLRRFGIFLLFVPGLSRLISVLTREPIDRLSIHRKNLMTYRVSYLKMNNFIHKNTDGPENVYSAVYSKQEATRLFKDFHDLQYNIHYLNDRHLPILRGILPIQTKAWLASRFGWHLWVRGVK